MFKKSKLRIVAAVMGVLILFLAATLFLIYSSSYHQVSERNREMLEVYSKAYWENGNPEGREMELPDAGAPELRGRIYQLSSFYSVAFDGNGTATAIDNNNETGMTDEKLTQLCVSIRNLGKADGVSGTWAYHVENNGDLTLVVLMDNTIMDSSMATLFQNTLLFGSVAILLLLVPVFLLVQRILRPLEENDKKQRQFISDASHELKTPVAVISTNAEMLERESGSSKWLDNIKYENHQMGELIRQLLNLARAENTAPAMEIINFSHLVTGSVLPFECLAFDKEQILRTEIQENLQVRGNADQLGNMVSALLENALEYAPRGGAIQVSVRQEHRMAVLTITNDGPEIPEEQKKNLFERFYRADTARDSASGHYGLGLAIVKATVTSHHGRIAVNCSQGKVSFTVSLPEASQKNHS